MDYGYFRGCFCGAHARSHRRCFVTAGAPCVGVCLSLCVFVWFSACEFTGNVGAPGRLALSRPGERGRDSRAQRPRSPRCPSLPVPSPKPAPSPQKCWPCSASPTSTLAPDWLGERGEGGYRVPLSGWQHFQARSDWRARPQIGGQELPAPPRLVRERHLNSTCRCS